MICISIRISLLPPLFLFLFSLSRGLPLISLLALTLIYGPWPPTWKTHSRERASFSACPRTWRRYLSTRLNPSRRGGDATTTYVDMYRAPHRTRSLLSPRCKARRLVDIADKSDPAVTYSLHQPRGVIRGFYLRWLSGIIGVFCYAFAPHAERFHRSEIESPP